MIHLALSLAVAQAEPPAPSPWGLPVADVVLVSERGGLPEESLQPLLRARQGEPLSPGVVRLDITTLLRVGDFASVEAHTQPWFLIGDDGEPRAAVQLSYVVSPPPRVSRVRVQGDDEVGLADVLEMARLDAGSAFFPELDAPAVERRVREGYARRGFPEAVVEVDPQPTETGDYEVWVRIDEGAPRLVTGVRFAGELPVPEARLRRVVERAGVVVGEPLSPEAVQRAQADLRARLASGDRSPVWTTLEPFVPTSWFARRRKVGWVQARTAAVLGEGPDGVEVAFTVDAGRLLWIDVHGIPVRGPAKAAEALGVDARLRLTRGFVDAAPERLVRALQQDGYLRAAVDLTLEDAPESQTLAIQVRRGPRHRLRSPPLAPAESALHGLHFEGNEAIRDWELRTVMRQASPEVLRAGHLTPEALERGLGAARELYASRGYVDAELTAGPFETDQRPSWMRLPGVRALVRAWRGAGTEAPMWVSVPITVDEGALTVLVALSIEGGAPDVDLSAQRAAAEALVGGPWSAQAVQRLSRDIIEAHRAAGHLEVDARVVATPRAPGEQAARIVVREGPEVLLRSVVARGARQTDPDFLQHEVDLALGQALTPADLDEVRSNLYDLGIFRSVDLELLGDESARDLVVQLTERPRNAAELGVGLSSDRGARVFARYSRLNLWGIGHRADLNGFAGLAGFNASDFELRAAGSYTAIRFPGRHSELVVDTLLAERLQQRTYELARTGGGVFFDTRLGPTQVRAGVRLELRRLVDADPGVILPDEPWAKLAEAGLTWRPQHSLSVAAVHDLRDDPLSPTRGALGSVRAELSPDLTPDHPGSVGFARVDTRLTSYVPLGAGMTLRLGGELGLARVLGEGVLPVEERYRMGGTASLRGFRRDSVGPRDTAAPPALDWPDALDPAIDTWLATDPTRWAPVGGDTQAALVAELLVPLPTLGLQAWQGYSAAIFADLGHVWLLDAPTSVASQTSEARAIFEPRLRAGVGAGLRVGTPVGPLQIDLALNPASAFATDPALRKRLREDWEEPPLRLHLSLGTLF